MRRQFPDISRVPLNGDKCLARMPSRFFTPRDAPFRSRPCTTFVATRRSLADTTTQRRSRRRRRRERRYWSAPCGGVATRGMEKGVELPVTETVLEAARWRWKWPTEAPPPKIIPRASPMTLRPPTLEANPCVTRARLLYFAWKTESTRSRRSVDLPTI